MLFIGTSFLSNILVVTVFLCFLLYKYVTRYSNYWRKRNVPGPTPTPFFGNIWETVIMKTPWACLLKKLYDSYDSRLVGLFTFDQPALIVRDPNIIKQILTKDFNYFHDRVLHQPEHNKIFGNTLFVLRNPKWKTVRAKMTPAFSSGKIKELFVVVQEVCQELINYMKSSDPEQESKSICHRFSTEIITQAFFGIRGQCFESEDSVFLKTARALLGFSIRNGVIQTIYFFKGTLVPLFKLEFFQDGIIPFFRDTFWQCLKNAESAKVKSNNFISLLGSYRENDETFADEDILVAQGLMFFVAGIETISSAIAFTLYELSLNTSIQQRVRSEINNIVQEKGLNYESIKEMVYLEMCIRESMRKYPPVPFLDRRCVEDYKVPGTDIIIEKDTPVYIPLLGLQNDEKYFPEPQKFIPERHQKNLNETALLHLPFGGGPRACIGERFGMLATKLAVAFIVMKFSIEPVPKTPRSVEFDPKSVPLSVKNGLPLKFNPLESL